MKIIKSSVVVFSCFLITCSLFSQNVDKCLEPEFNDKCFRTINHVFDDYVYLKSRAFSSRYTTDMFLELTLKRNILYLMTVCDGSDENPMRVDFYDNDENLIKSTYSSGMNKQYISFMPEKAGKFLLKVSFENNSISCSSVSYGMIKRNIESYIPPNASLK